jgi:hypothetical protein
MLTKIDKIILGTSLVVLIGGTIGDFYIYKGAYTLEGCIKRNIIEVIIFNLGYFLGKTITEVKK